MSFNQSFICEDSKVCLVENRFSIEELRRKFKSPELYKEGLEKMNSPYRKKEFLAIRYALKLCLNGEEKEICYSADGKPNLKDDSNKISFSHSKDWVAVIVHPKLNVGIDVEKPSNRFVRVRNKFLHHKELEYYHTHHSLEYLRIIWSAKEALYKVLGNESYHFTQQLLIEPFEIKNKGVVNAKYILTNKTYRVHYQLNDLLTLAFCIENE